MTTSTLTKTTPLTDDAFFWNSSTLDWAGYDANTKTLYVEFLSGTTVYAYADVPADVWEGFKGADSVGSYYHANIRGKYTRLPDLDGQTAQFEIGDPHISPPPSVYDVASQIVEHADEPFTYQALVHVVVPLTSGNPTDLARELTELIDAYNYAGYAYAVTDVSLVEPATWDL